MKQTECLELILGVELTFHSSLTGAMNMVSKEISMQVNKAIIKQKK